MPPPKVQLGHDAGHSEAGFGLCLRLRLFVLQLSPAVVAVRCLRASVGPSEVGVWRVRGGCRDWRERVSSESRRLEYFLYPHSKRMEEITRHAFARTVVRRGGDC